MTGADEQAIVDVISEFIKGGFMFTAYDVTKEVRNRGNTTIVHGQAKSIVHNYDYPSEYTRTVVPVPGVPVNPFLYHPKGADVSTYQAGRIMVPSAKVAASLSADAKSDLNASGTPIIPANRAGLFKSALTRLGFNKNPISNMAPSKPTFQSKSGFIVNLDARGRYIMRTSVIGAAGLFPGDQVFMFINSVGKDILLIKTDATTLPKMPKATTLTVDKDSNLLIFKKYIVTAFGNVPTTFEFTTEKNQIKIKAGY